MYKESGEIIIYKNNQNRWRYKKILQYSQKIGHYGDPQENVNGVRFINP